MVLAHNPIEIVSLGQDVNPFIGIGVTGLDVSADQPPTIEGFKTERVEGIQFNKDAVLSAEDESARAKLLKAIAPYLEANAKIPATSKAKVKGHEEITIDLIEGSKPQFIRQYKVPHMKMEAVDLQVSEPSPPTTA